MNELTTAFPSGQSHAQELFALTDEQILEIEPEAQDVEVHVADAASQNVTATKRDPSAVSANAVDSTRNDSHGAVADSAQSAQPGMGLTQEPPKWLAERMKDPWSGEEAREFWSSVQREREEASAYRQVFEKPEQARTAAERARSLDEFDSAYFGTAGKSTEELTAGRTALAQRMLRDDPTAFAEMVQAGLRALEAANRQASNEVRIQSPQSSIGDQRVSQASVARPELERHMAAYSSFERTANEELEKSVGGAIEQALKKALPNAERMERSGQTGAQPTAPLQLRLATAIRGEIEAGLKGDRQLGEQVAQILSSSRFDDHSRSQVVRLINERARQMVPTAAKRVLNEWTQTTLAAHRTTTEKQETASQRADLSTANSAANERRESSSTKRGTADPARSGNGSRTSGRNDSGSTRSSRIDYRKVSDEQILDS